LRPKDLASRNRQVGGGLIDQVVAALQRISRPLRKLDVQVMRAGGIKHE
jgi:hypothetical protein